MANHDQVRDLKHGGPYYWNDWRSKYLTITPDLRNAELRRAKIFNANLSDADLSDADLRAAHLGDADLRRANLGNADLREASLSGANLIEADLSGAKLNKAKLSNAKLRGANLINADLRDADFSGADLNDADLTGANLTGANLAGANLAGANLAGANLAGANLSGTNFSGANLTGANLTGANLREADFKEANLCDANLTSARLQFAQLDGASMTGIRLWETQRAGWSIKKIVCKSAYWDENGLNLTAYASGEFERLYADQLRIELFYKGGINLFELNTLPLLLYRLSEEHPNSAVRLSRVEESGGGTKVVISIDEGNASEMQQTAFKMQEWQIKASMSEQHAIRIEGLLKGMTAQFFDAMPKMLEAAAVKQNIFHGPVGSYVEGGSHHRVTSHQSNTGFTTIQQLAAEAQEKSAELHLSSADLTKLQIALANLQQPQTHHTEVIRESLVSARHILEHAAGAMLGHAAPEWLPVLVHNFGLALKSLGG